MVQPGMVEHLHDAADGSGLGVARAEDEPRNARMDDGSGAHGAGLQRDVELAAAEPVVAQRARGLAQGHDLRVGRGVAGGDHLVPAASHDLVRSQTTTAPTGTSPATSAIRASRSASSIQQFVGIGRREFRLHSA